MPLFPDKKPARPREPHLRGAQPTWAIRQVDDDDKPGNPFVHRVTSFPHPAPGVIACPDAHSPHTSPSHHYTRSFPVRAGNASSPDPADGPGDPARQESSRIERPPYHLVGLFGSRSISLARLSIALFSFSLSCFLLNFALCTSTCSSVLTWNTPRLTRTSRLPPPTHS